MRFVTVRQPIGRWIDQKIIKHIRALLVTNNIGEFRIRSKLTLLIWIMQVVLCAWLVDCRKRRIRYRNLSTSITTIVITFFFTVSHLPNRLIIQVIALSLLLDADSIVHSVFTRSVYAQFSKFSSDSLQSARSLAFPDSYFTHFGKHCLNLFNPQMSLLSLSMNSSMPLSFHNTRSLPWLVRDASKWRDDNIDLLVVSLSLTAIKDSKIKYW